MADPKVMLLKELVNRAKSGDGLAMDYASRMARAKEMGLTPMRHETTWTNEQQLLRADEGFDLGRSRAAATDEQMPRGVFVKPDDSPIGVAHRDEAVQMELMVGKGNQAEFIDRDGLESHLRATSPEWRDMQNAYTKKDNAYASEYDKIDNEMRSLPRKSEERNAARVKVKKLLDEWGEYGEKSAREMQDVANTSLREQGYDSIRVARDEGTGGRSVDTTVILDPSNIRSVNAAFDPAKRSSSNLLASAAPAAVGLGALGASDESEASFLGQAAKNADKMMLNIAQKMEKAGISPDEIWQKTGWGKGADDKWRFEVDDRGLKMPAMQKAGFGGYSDYSTQSLGDVYDSDVFKGYPELEKYRQSAIYTNNPDAELGGAFEPDSRQVRATGKTADETGSILGHETQHAVQELEGFAKGSSPSYVKSADLDIIVDDFEREFGHLPAVKKNKAEMPIQEYKAWARDMYAESKPAGMHELAHDMYLRSAGETEARNVQTRMNMTPTERRAKAPWLTEDVPRSQQIVKYGATPAAVGLGALYTPEQNAAMAGQLEEMGYPGMPSQEVDTSRFPELDKLAAGVRLATMPSQTIDPQLMMQAGGVSNPLLWLYGATQSDSPLSGVTKYMTNLGSERDWKERLWDSYEAALDVIP